MAAHAGMLKFSQLYPEKYYFYKHKKRKDVLLLE